MLFFLQKKVKGGDFFLDFYPGEVDFSKRGRSGRGGLRHSFCFSASVEVKNVVAWTAPSRSLSQRF